jgi:branched-chain amino acid aminotransferase
VRPSVYFDGSFVEVADARVGVFDGGWLHGAGLFETMRAQRGRVFRLNDHVDRLRRSAAELLRPIEPDSLPDEAVFAELLERNLLRDARVRMTVTAGSMHAPDNAGGAQLTVCVTASALDAYPAELYERGVQVAACDYRASPTDPISRHKTTAYLPRLLGLRQARLKRCMEALWFTTENLLAEGCISNVFIVKSGALATPPLDGPILPGITRGVILELARSARVETRESSLTVDDLLDADEVFLTNSIMQVLPVIRVEKHDIGPGTVGPVTKQLLQEYRSRVEVECERA